MNQIGIDVLYLCGCAIRKQAPDVKRLSEMDFQQVFLESMRHSLGALTFTGLERASALEHFPSELYRTWKNATAQATWKNLQLNYERQEICDWLESHGIWHMPLKGSLLQELYPDVGLREMTDNDILIDARRSQDVQDYMVHEREYSIYEYSPVESYDTVYQKPPAYNFEMHKRLFDEADPRFQKYYDNIKERLIVDDGKKYSYHFTDEEFYGYLLAHAYKHFSAGGVGLRTLTDCFVWNLHKRNSMNLSKLQNILDALGLVEFELQCRVLSDNLIGENGGEISEKDKEAFIYMLESGSFGNKENSIRNRIQKCMDENGISEQRAKRKLIFRKLFPDLHYYEVRVPFVYRHKALIPFYWVYRMMRKILVGGALKELKNYTEIDMQNKEKRV